MKYLPDLIYWIQQREQIRIRKEVEQKPPPWTSDNIIANNRWCNVHREDDKVTRWIFDNFMPRHRKEDTIPLAMCVARLVNWPDTLRDLSYPADGWTVAYRAGFLRVIAARRIAGLKSWTGAYMVTGGFSRGGEPKEVIMARVLDGAADKCDQFLAKYPTTLSESSVILTTPGIGSFLVAQILADLKNTDHLKKATDWWSWCSPGPGSIMGLNFIHDRPRSYVPTHEQFIKEVNHIREFIGKEIDMYICAQNTQNCLCELSKYIRAKYLKERLKNTYLPRVNNVS